MDFKKLSAKEILGKLEEYGYFTSYEVALAIKKWNQGDSIINTYKPYCDALFETNTLNKLVEALDETASLIESL